jgi:hypothetical protein
MFQLRGLSADDQWSEAASGEVVDMNAEAGGAKIVESIKNFFTSAPTVAAVMTQPTPTTQTTTMFAIPRPWYKTPIGILAIIGGGFVGWKYVLPKLRKK